MRSWVADSEVGTEAERGCPFDKSLPGKVNRARALQACGLVAAAGMQREKGHPSSSHAGSTGRAVPGE